MYQWFGFWWLGDDNDDSDMPVGTELGAGAINTIKQPTLQGVYQVLNLGIKFSAV
jgi:hypothetical protein